MHIWIKTFFLLATKCRRIKRKQSELARDAWKYIHPAAKLTIRKCSASELFPVGMEGLPVGGGVATGVSWLCQSNGSATGYWVVCMSGEYFGWQYGKEDIRYSETAEQHDREPVINIPAYLVWDPNVNWHNNRVWLDGRWNMVRLNHSGPLGGSTKSCE